MKFIKSKNYASRLRNDILSSSIQVIEIEKVPKKLISGYKKKGLKGADAVIGAFTEWVKADFLISENRHFLKELSTDKFIILDTGVVFFKKKIEDE